MDRFDLYIFDLDGTLIDSENLHINAYNDTFKNNNIPLFFDIKTYQKYAHFDDKLFKNFVLSNYPNVNYSKIYLEKKEIFLKLLEKNIDLIPGVENLLNKLFDKNINTCIVTNSDRDVINIVLKKNPLLKNITKIICKNDYQLLKPHPESYLKALSFFPYTRNPIGFEDSFRGFKSLEKINITKIFINTCDYYYYDKINCPNKFSNFHEISFENLLYK